MIDHDDLDALYEDILESPGIRGAPLLERLFKYLWRHRDRKTLGSEIWAGAWERRSDMYGLKPEGDVRYHCSKLSRVLDRYFGDISSESPDEAGREESGWIGWRIELPEGGPKNGYQLKTYRVNDTRSLRAAFWKPHLESDRKIGVVYVEQLFFHRWQQGIVFRYYDCNAEQADRALSELREKHPEIPIDDLLPVYPYAAWGELQARDLITRWFSKCAFRKVDSHVTRHLYQDALVWEESLVLLGSALGNRFLSEVLDGNPNLPIRLEQSPAAELHHRTRVVVDNVTEENKKRFEFIRDRQYAHYDLSYERKKCFLDFDPAKGVVPAILARLRNPRARRVPVTILNSDFGSAVQKLAHLVTEDEESLREGWEYLKITPPLPDYFQFLCAVQIRADLTNIWPLVWRPYSPPGF